MATTDRPPSKPERPPDGKAEREARLAEALRANLRRRKAGAGQGTADRGKDGDSE
jgi:hypothetical protein